MIEEKVKQLMSYFADFMLAYLDRDRDKMLYALDDIRRLAGEMIMDLL